MRYNPDLRTFRDHGGKLIQYHGWGDAAVAPRDSIDFYEKVTAFLSRYPDPRATDAKDVQTFYRLFMVPGTGHCTGGPGPTNFGTVPRNRELPSMPNMTLLLALDKWVMQGTPPDKLIGLARSAPIPRAAREELRSRVPCVHIQKLACYKGRGDTNLADNFECVENSAAGQAAKD